MAARVNVWLSVEQTRLLLRTATKLAADPATPSGDERKRWQAIVASATRALRSREPEVAHDEP